MGTTVKTWRALKTQNVEGKVRHFGDFVPEASEWSNLAVWIRSGHIEETFIDSDELAKAIEIQRANDGVEDEQSEALADEEAVESVEDDTDEEEGDEPNSDSDSDTEKAAKVLKIKKGKSNG